MFEKKTLQQHINEFTEKVQARESKINSKIIELEGEATAVRARIKNQNSQIVELDMADDQAGANKIRKSNRDLRLQLDEIQDAIEGYQSQLEGSDQYSKELEKIREAGNKATQERIQKDKDLSEQRSAVEAQIDSLKDKLKQIQHEQYVNSFSREIDTLRPVITYIDPRARTLDYSKQEGFIERWLGGSSSFDSFFTDPEQRKGVQVSVNNADWGELQALRKASLSEQEPKITKIKRPNPDEPEITKIFGD